MANVKWSDDVAFPPATAGATDYVVGLGGGGVANNKFLANNFVLAAGLAAGIAAWLAAPSSANLLAALTTSTGTGNVVFSNGAALVAPVLGTPASGTLTNCTGLPIAGIAGLGTGVATLLAAAATGTGALVGRTAPTFNDLLTSTIVSANTGVLASTGYSLTGSNATNMLDFAGTWNTSGAPTAFKVAVTNTASNASSLLMNFLAGTGGVTSILSLTVGGALTLAGTLSSGAITSSNTILAGQGNILGWTNRSHISSPVDGQILLQNNANNAFTFLLLGGTTSSFPAVTRSGTTVAFKLADNSGDCPITAAAGTFSGLLSGSAGVTIGSGQALKLGNAATTGLTAGVLAAITNASIVITDSTGQAYRVPCIV